MVDPVAPPADVPGPPPAAGAGLAGLWLWDAFFVVAAAATAVLVALSSAPVAARVTAAALVVAIGLAWHVMGRHLATTPGGDSRPGVRIYAAALVVAIVVAALLVPESSWALFVVLSQMFWLLRLSLAIVVAAVLTPGLPLLSEVATGGTLAGAVSDMLPQSLFMTAFGILVGIWIHRVTGESEERARLIAELERSQATVAELSHRTGVAAERERLAGEIHDTLAQGFTSIITLLQAAQTEFGTDPDAAHRHLRLAVAAAKENLQEARHLVTAAQPRAPDSLTDAIGRQVERFAQETGVDVAHGVSGPARRLPAEQEVVLLRAAQELLANIAHHAHAETVTVRLDLRDAGTVALTVADDGTGFDPEQVGDGSYGLAMMRSRVARHGGELCVDSAPGAGTVVVVTLPAGAES